MRIRQGKKKTPKPGTGKPQKKKTVWWTPKKRGVRANKAGHHEGTGGPGRRARGLREGGAGKKKKKLNR